MLFPARRSRRTATSLPIACDPEQSNSPLFRLPPELREMIWRNILYTAKLTPRAHFHIYDTVYDSCTYDPSSARDSRIRRQALRTAVLRACKIIYMEATHLLYETTHIELVLLAGQPRPARLLGCCNKQGIDVWNNIRRRNCLGPVAQCGVFARMKHVTLVIQAGPRPKLEHYQQRLRSVIEALMSEEGMSHFTIKINLHDRMGMNAEDCIAFLSAMTDTVSTLASPAHWPKVTLARLIRMYRVPTERRKEIMEETEGLLNALDGRHIMRGHRTVRSLQLEGTSFSRECERRGREGRSYFDAPARGGRMQSGDPSRLRIGPGTAVIGAPVVAAFALTRIVVQKVVKGQRP